MATANQEWGRGQTGDLLPLILSLGNMRRHCWLLSQAVALLKHLNDGGNTTSQGPDFNLLRASRATSLLRVILERGSGHIPFSLAWRCAPAWLSPRSSPGSSSSQTEGCQGWKLHAPRRREGRRVSPGFCGRGHTQGGAE